MVIDEAGCHCWLAQQCSEDLPLCYVQPTDFASKTGSALLLRRLTIRQRPGVETFRYWQEGPGYDRNLDQPNTILASLDYIHRNPVSRGLVEQAIDWNWSSPRWYEGLAYERRVRMPHLERLPAEFVGQAAR